MGDTVIHVSLAPPSFFSGGKRESNYYDVEKEKTYSEDELFAEEEDNEPNNLYSGLFTEDNEQYSELLANNEQEYSELFADNSVDEISDQLFTGGILDDVDALLNNDEVETLVYNDIVIYL